MSGGFARGVGGLLGSLESIGDPLLGDWTRYSRLCRYHFSKIILVFRGEFPMSERVSENHANLRLQCLICRARSLARPKQAVGEVTA
jgi:hypothetical protein